MGGCDLMLSQSPRRQVLSSCNPHTATFPVVVPSLASLLPLVALANLVT